MVKWVEVLRRVMPLYKVKTQAELAMALGAPVSLGMDRASEQAGIPWPILEIIVADKKVSWDWLLSGRRARETDPADTPAEDGEGDAPPPEPAAKAPPPETRIPRERFEPRELERELLQHDEALQSCRCENDTGEEQGGGGGDESVVRRLEELKSSMQREIDRVERLLAERR